MPGRYIKRSQDARDRPEDARDRRDHQGVQPNRGYHAEQNPGHMSFYAQSYSLTRPTNEDMRGHTEEANNTMIERYGASFPPGSQPGAMAAHCAPRPFVDIEDLQKTYEMSFHSSTKRDRTITPPPPQDIKLHPRLDEELRQDDGNLPSHRTRYHCAETGLISNFYHDNPTGQVARFYTVNNSNNHLPACGNSTQWGCRHMLAVVGGKDIGPPPQLDTRGEPVTGVEIEPTTEKNFERMISAEERERASIACTAAYEKLLRGLEMAKRNS